MLCKYVHSYSVPAKIQCSSTIIIREWKGVFLSINVFTSCHIINYTRPNISSRYNFHGPLQVSHYKPHSPYSSHLVIKLTGSYKSSHKLQNPYKSPCYSCHRPLQVYHPILPAGPYKFITLFFAQALTSLSRYSCHRPLQVYHSILPAGPYRFITLYFPQTLTISSPYTPHNLVQVYHVSLPTGPYRFIALYSPQALTCLSPYSSRRPLEVHQVFLRTGPYKFITL